MSDDYDVIMTRMTDQRAVMNLGGPPETSPYRRPGTYFICSDEGVQHIVVRKDRVLVFDCKG